MEFERLLFRSKGICRKVIVHRTVAFGKFNVSNFLHRRPEKCCRSSSVKGVVSSERLDEGARPVFSHDFVLADNSVQDFVPEYLREKFRERIEPNLCTIKAVCKVGDKTPYYTLTLSWYGNQAFKGADRLSTSQNSSSTNVSEARRQRSLRSLETSVELGTTGSTTEATRRCDGPCGQMRSVKELRVHGRCDHAICPLCIVNAPMIENVDGSMGCCNPECFAADLATLCPDPVLRHKYFQMIINKRKLDEITATYRGPANLGRLKRAMDSLTDRASSTSRSSSSKRGLKELIGVKVLVLEKGPMETVFRRRVINEIGSTEALRGTLQWVVGGRQKVERSRIFLNRGDDYKSSQLQEINLDRFGDKKMRTFPTTNGVLNFVVDYTNFIQGTSDSPYM